MLLCVLAALSGSCRIIEPRTQVMLTIDADANVRALASQLLVTVEGRNAQGQADRLPASYTFDTTAQAAVSWPFSLALIPYASDPRRSYYVTATLSDGTAAVGVQRVLGGFVAKQTLALQLFFSEDCLNEASLTCGSEETCSYGMCLPAYADARTLPPLGGFTIAADGGVVVLTSDGGVASIDAGKLAPQSEAPGDCGDGVVNRDELCDTGITVGDGACPTACVSDGCVSSALEGTGCQVSCVKYENTAITSGDGCCPAGADSTNDSDCVAKCGNGIVEMGETCEASDPGHPCPTMNSCRVDKCLVASITGDAASCTSNCETQLIEQCVAGDGCCPSACTHDLDSDCSASCGNGVVDATAGETCDKTSAADPCPTGCDDGDVCTRDYLTGSADNCSATCLNVPITAPSSGDGCCPAGANASNDSDCMAMCGNGVVEPGELCDSNCPKAADCDDGRPCTTDELTGSDCGVKCIHTPVVAAYSGDGCCPSGANSNEDTDCRPACGNGVVELGESCDGDCQTSCPRSNTACTENVISGTPCHLKCVTERITVTRDNDGCCLSGASWENDNDCPRPVCGNGRVEAGENCDGNCPSCEDNNPCTQEITGGTACNPTCRHVAVTVGVRDNCCPSVGASDPDCAPVQTCGNGKLEGDEICDGNCPPCASPVNTCFVITRDNMPDVCHSRCVSHPRTASGTTKDGCCPADTTASQDADCASVCGNGKVEPGEDCDGNCGGCTASSDACTTITLVNISDACHPQCLQTTKKPNAETPDRCCPSGASMNEDIDCPARCGNGVVETGEECDTTASTCVGCMWRELMP